MALAWSQKIPQSIGKKLKQGESPNADYLVDSSIG